MNLHNEYGKTVKLTDEIGKGGEARVLNVASRDDHVAKIYHKPTDSREAKIIAMVHKPPDQPKSHVSLAWPTEVLYNQGEFVGFTMPKVEGADTIFNFYNPQRRNKLYRNFSWHMMHRLAINLVNVVEAVHQKGHVVGDINESNILVTYEVANVVQSVLLRLARAFTSRVETRFLDDPLITFVDTDSFQVWDEQNQIHRSLVGKPEYTPPELQGVRFSEVDQEIPHDLFGLGVLLFQMLMEGFNPFAGVLSTGESVGRVDLYSIREGLFPYYKNSKVSPPPAAPQFGRLHPTLQTAFVRCFVDGYHQPNQRPTALEWAHALHEAAQSLTTCWYEGHHIYSNHLEHCPWCYPSAPISQVTVQVLPRPANFQPHPHSHSHSHSSVASPPTSSSSKTTQTPALPTLSTVPRPQATAELPPDKVNLERTLSHDKNPVTALAYSPSGAFLAMAQKKGQTVVWQVKNGKPHKIIGQNSNQPVNSLVFSPDEAWLAEGGYNTVLMEPITAKESSHKLQLRQVGGVFGVAFSPDGLWLAASCWNNLLYMWHRPNLQKPDFTLKNTLKGHTEQVRELAFTADGQTLISVGVKGQVRGWHVETGHTLYYGKIHTSTPIVLTGLAPGGWAWGMVGNDNSIVVQSIPDDKVVLNLTWPDLPPTATEALAFSADGQILFGSGADGLIRGWQLDSGKQVTTMTSPKSRPTILTVAPHSLQLASDHDHQVNLWSWGKPLTVQPASSSATVSAKTTPKSVEKASKLVPTPPAIPNLDPIPRPQATAPLPPETIIAKRKFSHQPSPAGTIKPSIKLPELSFAVPRQLSGIIKGRVNDIVFSPAGEVAGAVSDTQIFIWHVATGAEIHTIKGHYASHIYNLAFSPDGSTFASSGDGKSVRYFDMRNGSLCDVHKFQSSSPIYVTYHPDGKTLVSVHKGKIIRFWDVNRKIKVRTRYIHSQPVQQVRFSPDGSLFTTISGSKVNYSLTKTPNYWQTDRSLNHEQLVNDIVFGPNNQLISTDGKIHIWDLNTSKRLGEMSHEGIGWITSLAMSPDGSYLISACLEGHPEAAPSATLHVWDMATRQLLGVVTDYSMPVTNLAMSPDGTELLIGGLHGDVRVLTLSETFKALDGSSETVTESVETESTESETSLSLLDVSHLNPPAQLLCLPHPTDIREVNLSPDGQYIATNSDCVRVWQTGNGQLRQTITSRWDIFNIAFTVNQDLLVSEGTTHISTWVLGAGQFISHQQIFGITAMTTSPDGVLLAIAGPENDILVLEIDKGQVTQRVVALLKGHSGLISQVLFASDGQTAVSFDDKEILRVWDINTAKQLWWLDISGRKTGSFAISNDNQMLAIGGNKLIEVWRLQTKKRLKRINHQHHNKVAFTPDNQMLLAGNHLGHIERWQVGRGWYKQKKRLAEVEGRIQNLTFSADGHYLAITTDRPQLSLWGWSKQALEQVRYASPLDLPEITLTRRHVFSSFPEPLELFKSVAISPDGTLTAGGNKQSIQLWQNNSGKRIQTINASYTARPLNNVAFHPNSEQLVSSGWSRLVRLWDVNMGKVLSYKGWRDEYPTYAVYSPDGQQIAATYTGLDVMVWDIIGGKFKRRLQLEGHTMRVNRVCYSADGRLLASAGKDLTVRIWDAKTGQPLFILRGFDSTVSELAFSSDGCYLMAVDGHIWLWRVSDGHLLGQLDEGQFGLMECAAFVPNSDLLISGSLGQEVAGQAVKTIQQWSVSNQKLLAILTNQTIGVNSVAVSAEGRTLVTSHLDKIMRVWDLPPESSVV
ncbi:hypothetical protein QUF58_03790 [Anaerolineales bacterium HSG24]|nr:hypothetical protein [Anaerolineales bacterium HSG24]